MTKSFSGEIFSFHLLQVPWYSKITYCISPLHKRRINGLRHSETLFVMNLGEPIISHQRFQQNSIAVFLWWSTETALINFLKQNQNHFLNSGWHIRLKLYRRWGYFEDLQKAHVYQLCPTTSEPVVAITLARLKLSQTRRFIKWGKPVEQQVRDHQGQRLALAAMRPFNSFSTFSIWHNEDSMLGMVHGAESLGNGGAHRLAMQERNRQDFHYEFTTLRFLPIFETGTWKNNINFTRLKI